MTNKNISQKELADEVSKFFERLRSSQEINLAGIVDIDGHRFRIDYKQKWVDILPNPQGDVKTYKKILEYFESNGFHTNSSFH